VKKSRDSEVRKDALSWLEKGAFSRIKTIFNTA
jgi:hypothetical protein